MITAMPALTCPHCGVYARFTKEWERKSDPEDTLVEHVACLTCDYCRRPIVADIGIYGIAEFWPKTIRGKDFPDVPDALAEAAGQAYMCLSAGSPMGAVVVARAVIEAVAKDHGISGGDLKAKIDRLYDDGHITATMRDAATEIRFAGNEAAHGDLLAEVVEERPAIEDAGEIVALMDSILERLYQEPARIAKIRRRRETRKRMKGLAGLRPGDRVEHDAFGLGVVLSISGESDSPMAKIDFGQPTGIKDLVLKYAPVHASVSTKSTGSLPTGN
jgi:hypothetical protein